MLPSSCEPNLPQDFLDGSAAEDKYRRLPRARIGEAEIWAIGLREKKVAVKLVEFSAETAKLRVKKVGRQLLEFIPSCDTFRFFIRKWLSGDTYLGTQTSSPSSAFPMLLKMKANKSSGTTTGLESIWSQSGCLKEILLFIPRAALESLSARTWCALNSLPTTALKFKYHF
jgi:hypothetical protein